MEIIPSPSLSEDAFCEVPISFKFGYHGVKLIFLKLQSTKSKKPGTYSVVGLNLWTKFSIISLRVMAVVI